MLDQAIASNNTRNPIVDFRSSTLHFFPSSCSFFYSNNILNKPINHQDSALHYRASTHQKHHTTPLPPKPLPEPDKHKKMATEEDPFEGGNPEDEMELMAPMLVDKLQVSSY